MTLKRQPTQDKDIVIQGGVYYYRGTPPGLKRQIEMSLKIQEGAPWKLVKAAKEDLLERKERTGKDSKGLKVRQLKDKYIAYRRAQFENTERGKKKIRDRTFKEVEYLMGYIVRFFGKYRPEEIDEALWADYCEEHSHMDLANHRKGLNGFLKWCKLKRYIKYRTEFEIPPWPRRSRYVLKPEEIMTIMGVLHTPRRFMFVTLCLFHWLRPGEATKLRQAAIKLDDQALEIYPDTEKRDRPRIVPIHPFCLEAYALYLERFRGKWIFWHLEDRTRHATQAFYMTMWHNILKDAGLAGRDILPHDLRATGEAYGSTLTEFTRTAREKMAGSTIEVQDKRYITRIEANKLRGLEQGITSEKNGVQGLAEALKKQAEEAFKGKRRGNDDEE